MYRRVVYCIYKTLALMLKVNHDLYINTYIMGRFYKLLKCETILKYNIQNFIYEYNILLILLHDLQQLKAR